MERLRGHHGRGRLAVRAGDGNELAAAYRFTERLRAPNHGNAQFTSALELGMRPGERRRNHDRTGTLHVSWVVASAHGDAKPAEVARRIAGCITARHAHTSTHEQLGEGAHAGAGYSDEVDGASVRGIYERH